MDTSLQFLFRNKNYAAHCFFSFEKVPYLIFLTLQGKELIKYFGEEVTIKTDLRKVLPKIDDYRANRT
jgi:hypothetical protein